MLFSNEGGAGILVSPKTGEMTCQPLNKGGSGLASSLDYTMSCNIVVYDTILYYICCSTTLYYVPFCGDGGGISISCKKVQVHYTVL